MSKYARTLQELKERAVLFWRKELRDREAEVSVLPLLLETQDKFISVLTLADAGPDAWKKFVDLSEQMKGNLFLKHMMVLSDFAGEALNKLPPFKNYFKNGIMEYVWHEKVYAYEFKVIYEKASLTVSI